MSPEKFFARKREINGNVEYQTIVDHSENVSKSCQKFLQSEYFLIAELLGLVHDLGKYSEKFQGKLRGESISVNHSDIGAVWLIEQATNRDNCSAFVLKIIAFVVSSHHTGLGELCLDSVDENFDTNMLKRKEDASFLFNYNQSIERGSLIIEKALRIIDSSEFQNQCNEAMVSITNNHRLEIEAINDMLNEGSSLVIINKENIKKEIKKLCAFYFQCMVRSWFSVLVDSDGTDACIYQNSSEFPEIQSNQPVGEKRKTANWEAISEALDAKVNSFPTSQLNTKRKSKDQVKSNDNKLEIPIGSTIL